MVRLILYAIFIYLVYHLAKKFFHFLNPGQANIKDSLKKKVRTFDPNNIEDIDYQEVDKKDDS